MSFKNYENMNWKTIRTFEKKMNWEEESKVRKEPLDFCWVILDDGGTLKN